MNIDSISNNRMSFKRHWVEAAITGAATLAGAGVSAAGQSSLNKKTREFNKEEAAKQREWSEKMYNDANAWNYKMWQEEMDYNNPANQVQRLRDAGLNPMYYGLDGNSTNGGPDAAQPLGYERANATNMSNPMSSFEDAALKVAQISNIQADTAKKGEETLTEVQRREKIIAEIENTKQELNNLKAQEGLTKSQKEEIDKAISWMDRLNEATVAEKQAKAALDEATKKRIEELLEGEKLIQAKTIEDFDHKWQKISAEIALISKQTGIAALDIENYAINHANNGFMGTGFSGQNIIRGAKGLGDRIGNWVKEKMQRNPDYQGEGILAEDNR